MQEIKEYIKQLIGKTHVVLLPRGNKAIETALKLSSRKKVLIQDQGGWLTYKQYPKKQKLELIELKTDYGLVDLNDLKKKVSKECVLLLNSMPGYHAFERVKEISEICRQRDCFLINDVCGSIGTEHAKYGDIIIGSFGKWKPVGLGYGGFLASDKDYELKDDFDERKLNKLQKLLVQLPQRIKQFRMLNQKIKTNLKDFKIVHHDSNGYNVIIKFKNKNEKTVIEKYCLGNDLQFTLCPRYIRVLDDAVSIEVKRLEVPEWKRKQLKKENLS